MAYLSNFTPMTEVPENPADYKQDPSCPEGKYSSPDSGSCIDDPVYVELMKQLNEELRELEEQEQKAARMARIKEEQQRLRVEQEMRRVQMDEARRLQKIEEAEQVRTLAVYGIGGLGVLIILTLIIKVIF